MQSVRLRRLLAVVVLAAGMFAVVSIVAPRQDPVIEPGISTATTLPAGQTRVELPDPCDLVTTTDAATALGGPVVAAREGEASCVYAGRDHPAVTVRVDVAGSTRGIEQLATERAQAVRAFGAGAVVDVAGLGEASFLTLAHDAGIALLRVACGDLKLVIGIAGPVPDAAAIARDLAMAAVGRL